MHKLMKRYKDENLKSGYGRTYFQYDFETYNKFCGNTVLAKDLMAAFNEQFAVNPGSN